MGTTTEAPKTPEDPNAARRKALAETLGRAEEAAKVKRYGEAAGICQDLLDTVPGYPPALALLGGDRRAPGGYVTGHRPAGAGGRGGTLGGSVA